MGEREDKKDMDGILIRKNNLEIFSSKFDQLASNLCDGKRKYINYIDSFPWELT